MANNSDRYGLIGAALGLLATCIVAGIWLRLILGHSKPLPAPEQTQQEQELDDLTRHRNPDIDLERGVVGGEPQLRDPDTFLIPEEDEGGESDLPTTDHVVPMINSIGGETHGKKVKAPPKLELNFTHATAYAYNGNRDDPLSGKELMMCGAIPTHEDDNTPLIPSAVSLSKGGSKRSSRVTSFISDPFDLSHFLSRRSGRVAPNVEATPVGSDSLPAVPKPVMARGSRAHSSSRWPEVTGLSGIAGASRADDMPDPLESEVVDTDISSGEGNPTQLKPAPPKASRYRGLSATRPDRRRSHLGDDHAAPQNPGPPPTDALPLPAPGTFAVNTRPDSWEKFSSAGFDDTGGGNPDEWTSQICSTVAEP